MEPLNLNLTLIFPLLAVGFDQSFIDTMELLSLYVIFVVKMSWKIQHI